MRVVFFVRHKKRTRTPMDLVLALRDAGHTVKVIHYGNWRRLFGHNWAQRLLLPNIHRFRPDLVLLWKEAVEASLLAELDKHYKTGLWCVDYFESPPSKLLELARIVDVFLLTNTGQLDEYKALGVKQAEYLPQACGYREHRADMAASPAYNGQVAFIGQPSSAPRQNLLQQVDRQFDLKLWGPGWESYRQQFRNIQLRDVRPRQYSKICASSQVILGVDYTSEVEMFFSSRTWLTLGCGGFFVTNYCPGLETVFENHHHLVWYHDADECIELIRHYLARPDDRRRIAEAGRDYVHSHHTYLHRARRLVEIAEALPEKP